MPRRACASGRSVCLSAKSRRSLTPARLARRLGEAALLLAALVPAASFAAPAFTTQGPLSTDTGYVTLEWEGGGTLTLEQSGSPAMEDARVVYSGANHALFLSGLADGTYYFTLQDENGARSAPLELSVTHQSLAQALWLSAIGALVFLSVLAVIVRGARDEQ